MKSEILTNILAVLAFIFYVVLTSGMLGKKTKPKQELERKFYVIEMAMGGEWKEYNGKYFTDFSQANDKMHYYRMIWKHQLFRIKQIE